MLSVITNIGLDHCEHLGFSLPEVAAEKAGIIKAGVPVVIGERGCPEVEEVFIKKAQEVGAPILFAEDVVSAGEETPQGRIYRSIDLLGMDLKGACQEKNIKSVAAALGGLYGKMDLRGIEGNIHNAANVTGLRGRWEILSQEPLVICDTGHNSHGFKVLGPQICKTAQQHGGKLHMVFGVVADKDIDSIVEYLPRQAYYHFVKARGTRALPAKELEAKMRGYGFEGEAVEVGIVEFLGSMETAKEDFVFIGGSTFVVAEALEYFG